MAYVYAHIYHKISASTLQMIKKGVIVPMIHIVVPLAAQIKT
jgi:hypothetical protein